MNLVRIIRVFPKIGPRNFATAVIQDDEYTTRPEYPPILDLSFKAKLKRKKQALHEEIKEVKTVEEKQIKLNMPRYYGFKCYLLNEDTVGYNSLDLVQHITRTHLIQNTSLPDFYKSINVDQTVQNLKSEIEEIIITELDGYQNQNEKDIASLLSRAINRAIINQLSSPESHLLNVQVEYDSRIESSWFAGGMLPPPVIKKCRKGKSYLKDMENDPIDRLMVYTGSPILSIRSELPLQFIIPPGEVDYNNLDVPFWEYDPRTVGVTTDYRPIVNTPGCWPGDMYKFGLLSIHKRQFRHTAFERNIRDDETLKRQGIIASFGWLQAQANFLGFNTFNDITYPIVTQTVITDGKFWSFFTYQMNTLLVNNEHIKENPKKNICWSTDEIKLFEGIEGDKVVGLNEDVLRMLVQFYTNGPEERLGVNLTPYLSSKEKVNADYEDDDKRQWIEKEYKILTSRRPRYLMPYELYHWEKIYKVDHQTRFMDKRLRPFERFENPYKRRLDDRLAPYVPKALRPDMKKHIGRKAKQYFP